MFSSHYRNVNHIVIICQLCVILLYILAICEETSDASYFVWITLIYTSVFFSILLVFIYLCIFYWILYLFIRHYNVSNLSCIHTFSSLSAHFSLFPISFYLIQAQPCCAVFSHLKWSEWLWLSEFRWRNLSTLQFSLLSEDGEKLTRVNVDKNFVDKLYEGRTLILKIWNLNISVYFFFISCASKVLLNLSSIRATPVDWHCQNFIPYPQVLGSKCIYRDFIKKSMEIKDFSLSVARYFKSNVHSINDISICITSCCYVAINYERIKEKSYENWCI